MLAVLEAPPAADRYFPIDLVPLAAHPAIAQRGGEVQRQVRARHLLRYLHFTRALEIGTVNRVAEEMCFPSRSASLWDRLPAETRQHLNDEAYSIYREEAEHALEAHKLLGDIEVRSVLRWDRRELPTGLRWLNQRIAAETDTHLGFLLLFGFVCVSETLVTQTLCRLPNDPQLLPSVREFAADHARDEARHSRFFSTLFGQVWRVLHNSEREFLGRELVGFIRTFGQVDAESIAAELREYGFSQGEQDAILRDLSVVSPVRLRQEASRALRMFQDAGVFMSIGLRADFVSAGLLDS